MPRPDGLVECCRRKSKKNQFLAQRCRRKDASIANLSAYTLTDRACVAPLWAGYRRFEPRFISRIEGRPTVCVNISLTQAMGKILLSGSDCASVPAFVSSGIIICYSCRGACPKWRVPARER